MKRWIPVKNYQDQNRVKENIETAFMDLWQWPVGLWPWSILSRIAITSTFKVTVWAAHQFFQLILLSVWPRGPHFTVHSHTVFLPLMHRLFWQLGDNQSWNRKGRKAIRDALALLALRSQKSRTQRMLKHKKKMIMICLGSTDYSTVIVRGTLRMLNAQLSPSAFLLCSNSPK